MTAASTRIYLATILSNTNTEDWSAEHKRLVRAPRVASVLMHVAKDLIDVRVPSQDELIAARDDGIVIESVATAKD